MVDDAIRFVSSKTKEKRKSYTEGDKEESMEHDYDEDMDRPEEEQEEQTHGEMTTINTSSNNGLQNILHSYNNLCCSESISYLCNLCLYILPNLSIFYKDHKSGQSSDCCC